jgi:hypothetical protein
MAREMVFMMCIISISIHSALALLQDLVHVGSSIAFRLVCNACNPTLMITSCSLLPLECTLPPHECMHHFLCKFSNVFNVRERVRGRPVQHSGKRLYRTRGPVQRS